MKSLKKEYVIKSPLTKVWEALTSAEKINDWGAGPCEMDDQVGTNFSLWDGDIHGTNVEMVPEDFMIQDWYGGDWDEPSRVTINLTEEEGGTNIELLHENIPASELESIEQGWDEYYFGPLKEYLEDEE